MNKTKREVFVHLLLCADKMSRQRDTKNRPDAYFKDLEREWLEAYDSAPEEYYRYEGIKDE